MKRFAKVPYSARILLTNRCNLNCCFCLNEASDNAPEEELQTSEWLAFFETLKELRIFDILLSGGEIFLRKDIFTLLTKLHENRMHRVTIFSNGTLIDEEIAHRLNEVKIKRISISVDGLKEKHDQIRGEGSFQKSVKGIQNLIDVGIIPVVAFTPIKSNYMDLGQLIDLAVSLGIRTIRVNSLSPEGRCINIYENLTLEFPNQERAVLDVVEEKKKEYPDLKIDCSLGFYYYLPESYKNFQRNPQNYKMKYLKDGCGAALTSFTITSTGEVIPCEGFTAFSGGNIREQDLLDIWTNSENFKKIRNLGNIAMDQTPYCKECKYIYLCDAGCRASAYLIYKDLLAPGIHCPFWKGKQTAEKGENKDYPAGG